MTRALLIHGNTMNKGLFILITGLCFPAFLCSGIEQAASGTSELNEQLEINKNALLVGSDEQIRSKAASLMLDSGDPAARGVILDVLGSSENQRARIAVCQAIAASRGKRVISNSQEFIEPLMSFLVEQKEPSSVRLGAEALQIFDYGQIEQPLLSTIADTSLPIESRLNAVQALRLQPDIRAIVQLIELLDDEKCQEVANHLLQRYTEQSFQTKREWQNWFEKNRKQIYFSDFGGFKFRVVPKGYLRASKQKSKQPL